MQTQKGAAAHAAPTHLAVQGLSKTFGDHRALASIDLTVARGELVTLLGPSGCGKTTLLRCIAGFIAQDAGHIRIDGRSLDGSPPHKRNFGMVFQGYAVFPHLTVAENVAYGLRARGVAAGQRAERVARALDRVQLSHLAQRFPDALSGGQKQRVGIARALVIEPDLLLMDEPLSNLDAKLRVEMRQEIRLMQRELGITTLYVTHDQDEAMSISDRVAVMQGGVIQQIAPPEVVFDDPANAFVADFIGGCNWIEAEVAGDPAVLHIAGEAALPLPPAAGVRGPVRAGIRAEDLGLAAPDAPGLAARVLVRSFLGPRTRLRVETPGGLRLDVDLPSADCPREGDALRLAPLPGRIRLYARDDGRRLA
ncbi:MAG: ABC transporter ATP-binding protein [Rhodobacterales bacterium]|nr:ABC transporter ATP-binding protein [Rhodobacterales bacterium]